MNTPVTTANRIRARVRRTRAARAQRQRLVDELSAYRTVADRAELDAILSRHSADEIRDIERILSTQAVRAQSRTHPRR